MEKTNPIIKHLNEIAALGWQKEQGEFFKQRAADARSVECVRMRDVFTPDQLAFISQHFHARKKMCYKNASDLVTLLSHPWAFLFTEPVRYVEGFVMSGGLWPIEHAFVKVGDKYIDPTFERALKINPAQETYASLIELDSDEMSRLEAEFGYYGDLYRFAFMKQHRPEKGAKAAGSRP